MKREEGIWGTERRDRDEETPEDEGSGEQMGRTSMENE